MPLVSTNRIPVSAAADEATIAALVKKAVS
jgi:hypothetical protein